MSTARAIYRSEMGSWRGSLNLVILGLLGRAFLIYVNYKVYLDPKGKEDFVFALLILNLVFLVVEGITLLLLYRFKDVFMPTEQERQVAMRKLSQALGQDRIRVPELPRDHREGVGALPTMWYPLTSPLRQLQSRAQDQGREMPQLRCFGGAFGDGAEIHPVLEDHCRSGLQTRGALGPLRSVGRCLPQGRGD